MILIADSGSTKTSWCYLNKKQKVFLQTPGINPFFRNTEDIFDELKKMLLPELPGKVEKLVFYGAGIINEEKGRVVKNALSGLFPEAVINVYSDLMAAAHATLGNKKGIVCILGTGSNSCLYDGREIIEHIPPLGFMLGDEGSGAILGKKLIADYLKGIIPESLAEQFKSQFPMDYSAVMENIYKKENPNRFTAKFVPFLGENIKNSYCVSLVENSFQEFVDRNIKRYKNYQNYPVNFVGSIAFVFKTQLKKVLENNNLELGIVEKEPLKALVEFHTKNT